MSAVPGSGIKTVVYVRLLDEGTEVWRPAPAIRHTDGSFTITEPNNYDPEVETWEFPPRSRVRCVKKSLSGGSTSLIAVAAAR